MMMNVSKLLIVLGIVGATNSLMSSETVSTKPGYLLFKCDNSLHIIGYGCKNMDFLVPGKEFMRKVLTEAVPLSDGDKARMNLGFNQARATKKRQDVPYTLENAQFLAKITYKQHTNGFSVKVKEVAN
jgi:hypothetical protein